MQILQEIVSNSEGMWWYQFCAMCIGVSLFLCRDGERKWYQASVYITCLASAYLWGSMLLYRLYFNQLSFLLGGIMAVFLSVLLFAIKKGSEKYLLCFWCLAKVFIVAGNYAVEHDFEKEEEKIFVFAIGAALLLFMFMLFIAAFCRLKKRNSININVISKVFSLIYGSVLVTGCIYESVYDVIIRNSKFLSTNEEYINFYKAILKVDWTEDGTGIIFAILCVVMIIFGVVYQWRGMCHLSEKEIVCDGQANRG